MALPASGAISLNNVNVELGLSGTATISMNDAAVRTLFAKSGSGTTISMSDGYGKSSTSDPNFSQVSLLLHLNGANGSTTFTDNSPVGCSFGANNSAALSTAQKKFGTASLSLNGTSYLTTRTDTSAAFTFGTGDFTIELFAYFTTINPTTLLYDVRPGGNGLYSTIYMSGSGNLQYYVNGGNRITGPLLTTGTWYHIAVARSGTSTKMFLDGTQVGATYTDSNNYANGGALRPLIGASAFSTTFGVNGVIGYIDEVRVTKGVARYTANTTAPTAEFPNS